MYSSPSQWPLVTGTLLIVSAASCQPAQESPDGPRQWALIEELSIGSLDGLNGEPTFGMLSEVVGTSDGGAIVVDVQVPAVFRFGAGGELLHQLGRRGDGPGEYRDVSGVAVMGDGRVLVRDSRRALMFFDADGHLASEWPVRVDFVGSDPVAVIDGGVLLRTIARRSSLEVFWEAPTYDFVHVQYPGVVADTLTPLPSYRHAGLYRAPFHPTYHLAWLSDGSLVHGAGSEYRIEILGPSGDTLAYLEQPSEPLPLHEEARLSIEEHLAWLEARGNRSAPFYPEPPDFLPVFDRLIISSTDEIWVQRAVGVNDGDLLYRMDIFDRTGAHLGWLSVPNDVEVHSITGGWVWGIRRGEYEEEYVVRFRIEHADQQSS